MFSWPLFKGGMRSSLKVIVIIFAVLALYFSSIVSMYDPEIGKTLDDLMASMPEMMAMFGMDQVGSNLTEFLANYLYGFLMLIFPMIYSILTANRLIARHIEKGSMAYLLASPNRRTKVIVTQMCVQLAGLVVLILSCTAIGIIAAQAMFPGELDIGAFVRLNIGVLLLHVVIGGLCFLASSISNDSKLSLGIGAGVPIAFYLLQMLANMGGKLESLKYATIFTLFDTDRILSGDGGYMLSFIMMAVIGVVLFGASIFSFNKRDLPL